MASARPFTDVPAGNEKRPVFPRAASLDQHFRLEAPDRYHIERREVIVSIEIRQAISPSSFHADGQLIDRIIIKTNIELGDLSIQIIVIRIASTELGADIVGQIKAKVGGRVPVIALDWFITSCG